MSQADSGRRNKRLRLALLCLLPLMLGGCQWQEKPHADDENHTAGFTRARYAERVCVEHRGVRSLTGNAGYGLMIVCGDGSVWDSNPSDDE